MRNGKLALMALTAGALLLAAPGTTAKAAEKQAKKTIVFILADNEYRGWRTVPEFAKILEDKYGFQCEFLTSATGGDDPNRFYVPRMDKVKKADLVVVYARRRALPKEQMRVLRDYLDSGRPLIGIRTASHAFDANLVVPKEGGAPVAANVKLPAGLEQWKDFDKEVLGCSYHGHYGVGDVTIVTAVAEKKMHPILTGVPEKFQSPSWLYAIQPLAPTAEALMMGKIAGKPAEPVLLTNIYKNGNRIVYTSLGHWDDFQIPAFQRILINSIFWTMKMDVPKD